MSDIDIIKQAAIDAASLCRGSGNKAGSDALDLFAGRLAPAKAEEPEEPLTGWRAKCEVFTLNDYGKDDGYRVQSPDKKYQLTNSGRWASDGLSEYERFTLGARSAALAALRAAAPPPGVEEDKRGPWSICSRCEGEDPTCYIHGEPGVEEDKPLTCPPDKCNCFGPSMTPCPIHPYKPAAFCKSDAEDIVAKCEQWFDIGKHPDGPEFRATMGWIYERAKRLAARDGERSQTPAPEVRPMSMLDRARSFEAVEGDA